ncbi:MAG: hypothetical protein LUG51_12510, partial [Tannerellaceae bacterium]|nr:hypothetical protein [Tannerellaceae bacterium]
LHIQTDCFHKMGCTYSTPRVGISLPGTCIPGYCVPSLWDLRDKDPVENFRPPLITNPETMPHGVRLRLRSD